MQREAEEVFQTCLSRAVQDEPSPVKEVLDRFSVSSGDPSCRRAMKKFAWLCMTSSPNWPSAPDIRRRSAMISSTRGCDLICLGKCCQSTGGPPRSQCPYRAHTARGVKNRDHPRRSMRPAHTHARKPVGFGKGARDDRVLMTRNKLANLRAISGLREFAIGHIEHQNESNS